MASGPEHQEHRDQQEPPIGSMPRRLQDEEDEDEDTGISATVTTRMARKRSTVVGAALAERRRTCATDLVDVADRREPPAEAGQAAEDGRSARSLSGMSSSWSRTFSTS